MILEANQTFIIPPKIVSTYIRISIIHGVRLSDGYCTLPERN